MPTKSENPFSTCFTKPGQIPFIESESIQLAETIERFVAENFVGQILGPHGSGKTTITFDLQRQLSQQGGQGISFVRKTVGKNGKVIEIADRIASSSRLGTARAGSNRVKRILVIDGFERLPWYARVSLIQRCRADFSGLLITSHRRIRGIPIIARRFPASNELLAIVRHLLADKDDQTRHHFLPERLDAIFEQNAGNLRECLMTCYDQFEANCCKT